MLEEIVKGVGGFTAAYSIANVMCYLQCMRNSIIINSGLGLSVKEHMNMGLEIFRYNFGRCQVAATVLAAPPLLYNLYQLTK